MFHWCVLDNIRHVQYYERLKWRYKTGCRFLWNGTENRFEKWIIRKHYDAMEKHLLDDDT